MIFIFYDFNPKMSDFIYRKSKNIGKEAHKSKFFPIKVNLIEIKTASYCQEKQFLSQKKSSKYFCDTHRKVFIYFPNCEQAFLKPLVLCLSPLFRLSDPHAQRRPKNRNARLLSAPKDRIAEFCAQTRARASHCRHFKNLSGRSSHRAPNVCGGSGHGNR